MHTYYLIRSPKGPNHAAGLCAEVGFLAAKNMTDDPFLAPGQSRGSSRPKKKQALESWSSPGVHRLQHDQYSLKQSWKWKMACL